MTYEEKITFCKLHLGEKVHFSDDETFNPCSARKLGGLSECGFFFASSGVEWKFCRLIPNPQFIDWTIETAESVQLRRKSSGAKVWINYGSAGAWYRGADGNAEIPYSELRQEWETVDGRPCGTEVKDA